MTLDAATGRPPPPLRRMIPQPAAVRLPVAAHASLAAHDKHLPLAPMFCPSTDSSCRHRTPTAAAVTNHSAACCRAPSCRRTRLACRADRASSVPKPAYMLFGLADRRHAPLVACRHHSESQQHSEQRVKHLHLRLMRRHLPLRPAQVHEQLGRDSRQQR